MKLNKIPRAAWIQLVLLILVTVFWISSCSPARIHSDTPFEQAAAAVSEAAGSDYYPSMDAGKARKYISLSDDDCASWAFYRTSDAYNAQELLIAQFDTPEQADALEEVIESRMSRQIQTYQGYAPAQEALLKAAVVDFQDNYVLYYVGEDPKGVQSAFEKALREGGAQ